jgi:tetratricopeptide (TPR) repeat protein
VAFDLGEHEAAIRHYDAAAQRYASDPASLVAMVQIVNCYVELGRWQEARTANERARRRLRELPPEALDAPDLPMTRRHWERWLDAAAAIDALAEADDR